MIPYELTSSGLLPLSQASVTPPDPGPQFPGDQGAGKVLSGGTVWTGSAGVASGIDWLDDETGKLHVLSRTYSSSSNGWNWSMVDDAINVGRIPFHTAKFEQFSTSQITSGAADSALASHANQAQSRAPYPIWLGYYHEPEDNFETDQAAAGFRAACRYIVTYMRSAGVTNVAWVFPVWMIDWSFTGGVAVRGNAWKWDPDWKGSLSGSGRPNAADWYTGAESVVDLLGADQYTPTIGGSSYHTFADDFVECYQALVQWGRPMRPWAIGEMGTKDITPAPNWTSHFAQALETFITYDIRGYVYYNTDLNNFVNADPSGDRFAGYNAMVQDSRVLAVGDLVGVG